MTSQHEPVGALNNLAVLGTGCRVRQARTVTFHTRWTRVAAAALFALLLVACDGDGDGGGGGSSNVLPVASFTVTPSSGAPPLAVAFNAAGSSDADGTIARYAWTFGDAVSATGITANHTYTTVGTYTVTLTVTDNSGGSAQATQTVQVNSTGNLPPTAAFLFTPAGGSAPLPVFFDGSTSTDPEGPVANYAWDFGDGSIAATGKTLTHTFATPGVFTIRLTVADSQGLTNTTTQTITVVAGGGGSPTIVLSAPEPLWGPVALSISGGGTYASVGYYFDSVLVGTSTQGPGYPLAIDASRFTDGAHLIIARLNASSGSYTELRRTVQVLRPELTVELLVNASGLPGMVQIGIMTTSDWGVSSVSAAVDGTHVGTLTDPNTCFSNCTGVPNAYVIVVPMTSYVSGTHTITAQAIDVKGNVASDTTTAEFNNAPALLLTSPVDGILANGTLEIAGSFSSDKVGEAPRLVITFGSVPVLTTTTSPFATTFSLAGFPVGNYTLTAVATDSTGKSTTVTALVSVTSTPALAYTPVFSLPTGGSLWDAEDPSYVYSQGHLYDYYPSPFSTPPIVEVRSGSIVTTLSLFTASPIAPWYKIGYKPGQYANGHVFAYGNPGDLTGNVSYPITHVYMWAPDGTRTDLSAIASPNASANNDTLVAVHWPWVLWAPWKLVSGIVAGAGFVMHNVATGDTDVIPVPVDWTSTNASDFYLSAAGEPILYFGVTGGPQPSNIMVWSQATGQVTAVTSDGYSRYPASDGAFVAWQFRAPTDAYASLRVLDLANDTVRTLTTAVLDHWVADGLVVWKEPSTSGTSLLAYDGATTNVVSTLAALNPNNMKMAISGGYVVFEENSKLYAWSPARGRRILFESKPAQLMMHGKTVYFVNGLAVYAVPLE
jgi:PKD repeat protein